MPSFLANVSRRNLIFFTALVMVIACLYLLMVQIPQSARARLEAMFDQAGFENAKVTSVTLRPGGLRARNIKLDSYGFDEIKLLDADFNWLTFLTTGKVSQLNIKDVNISRTPENISASTRQLVENLLHLPDYRINITNTILDLGTQFGNVRFTVNATINAAPDGKNRDIKARIVGNQYQIGFDSSWEGTLKEDGNLDLSANVTDGRLNLGPLRMARFNGWMAVSASGGKYNIQSQMEAGSASFMDVPLQKISLVNEHTPEQSNVILRSGISGMPDVLFTGDFLQKGDAQIFTALLKGDNLGSLLDYIEEATGHKKSIRDVLEKSRGFELKSQFQPERRFVGGPLPFSLTLNTDGRKTVDGNFLFYPDTLDARGSLETSTEIASALQDYFKIPSENINQNFIRLDGSMKRFFQFGNDATAPAKTN